MSDRLLSVTIKVPESEAYKGDNPWFVFSGDDIQTIKKAVVDTFGIDVSDYDDVRTTPLSRIVVDAQLLIVAEVNAIRGDLVPTPALSVAPSNVITPSPDPWASPQQQTPSPSNAGGAGSPHPAGKQCSCGRTLIYSTTKTGKAQWKCPDYRWSSREGDNGHACEWINNR